MHVFRQIPCFSAGASFLLQRLFLCSFLKLLEQKGCAPDVHTSELLLAMDPFFPEFSCGAACLSRIGRCGLIPKMSCSSVKSTWVSVALYPGIRNPIEKTSSIKQPILSTSFLQLFIGLISLHVPEQTLVADFASRFRFVILTCGRMPIITRRIRAIPFKVILARL